MEGRLLTAVLCIFTILIASPCWALMEDEGLHEVVVRIPAESASAKLAVINELVHLGYGSECPKSEQPYIDVKLPEREVAKLKQLKLSTNFTIVEDPVRAEYLRFVEEASKRTKRSAVERADPFDDMFNHYHSQQQISAFLDEIVAQCPTIARKFSIGKTVSGEDMWAIHITDNPDTREVGEPEVQYIANMHGDEVVGRELMLYFIHHLCIHYHQPRVKAIVDNLDLYILPTMNPDGFAGGRRANKHGRDLNRNFPDQYTASTWGGVNPLPPVGNSVNGQYVKSSVEHEPEVEVVMKWMGQHAFALAANFHGGSVVANYPFDGNRQHSSGSYAGSPDDVLYRGLARAYAANNSPMSTSREFPSGITNGAQWYVLYGGMQDYAYLWHGTMHITVELSEVKWPNVASLSDFWEQNRESLLAYLEQAKYRVWGVVTDCASGAPIKAGIVEPSAASCSSNCRLQAAKLDSTTGEYHRLVSRAGDRTDYVFKVSAPGYNQASKTISVRAQSSFPLRLDICLNKSS